MKFLIVDEKFLWKNGEKTVIRKIDEVEVPDICIKEMFERLDKEFKNEKN